MSKHTLPTLLYDADCGFCQTWVNWCKRQGAEVTVQFQPCQFAEDIRNQAGIRMEDCFKSAFFVSEDGSVLPGAAAINAVLKRLPGALNLIWRLLGACYELPVIQQIENIGYRLVANARYHLGAKACTPYTADDKHSAP